MSAMASTRTMAGTRAAEDDVAAETLTRLRLAVSRLARSIRQQSGVDLSPSQLSALFSVERLGLVALGELAAVEGVRGPSISRCVATLEALGLLERSAISDDRRVARVALTAQGRRTLARARRQRNAWLAARVAGLGPEERRALVHAVAALEHLVELSL